MAIGRESIGDIAKTDARAINTVNQHHGRLIGIEVTVGCNHAIATAFTENSALVVLVESAAIDDRACPRSAWLS